MISLSILTTSLVIRNMFEDDESEWHPKWRFKHLKRHMAFVPRGFIRYYVLRLLNEKPMSGSEIIQYVEEKSGGRWRPSPGSVYPLLAWLQENKYVREVPAEEPGIKRYTLTDEGKKFLEEHEKRRAKMEERFKSFGPGSFFEPPWLNAPEGIRAVVKADIELHNTLWKLRHTVAKENIEETASKVVEILKEATQKIEELTEKRTNK
jgi:DNA-binding PadR family transcriptional regulator